MSLDAPVNNCLIISSTYSSNKYISGRIDSFSVRKNIFGGDKTTLFGANISRLSGYCKIIATFSALVV